MLSACIGSRPREGRGPHALGYVKVPAPGYPAAAARPFNSSCKMGEKRTVPRPRNGEVGALSGKFRYLVHGRLCPGHPCLSCRDTAKTWMPEEKPGHDDVANQ